MNLEEKEKRRFRKRGKAAILILGTVFVLFVCLFFDRKEAQAINNQMTFQGKLTDSSGNLVSNGTYYLKLTIYDAASGGTCQYTASSTCSVVTSTPVTVTNGIFSINLGDTSVNLAAISSSLFNNSALYLGITVCSGPGTGCDSEMSPRKRLTSSPYAFNADYLGGVTTSTSGGNGSYIPATDNSGNLKISNSFYAATSTAGQIGFGTSTVPSGAKVFVDSTTASDKLLVIRANSSQTGNLQEWQNNNGKALAFLDTSGFMYIGDGSTSSTLQKDLLKIAYSSSDPMGKFYVDSSGNTSASGTLTVFGNTATFKNIINNSTAYASSTFVLTNRNMSSFPVPYLTPYNTNNTPIALDIFPVGTPTDQANGTAWIDVCSTDIAADVTNYECLTLGKKLNSVALVGASKGGNGTQRDLTLQPFGGKVGLGTYSPNNALDIVSRFAGDGIHLQTTTTVNYSPGVRFDYAGTDTGWLGAAFGTSNWATNAALNDIVLASVSGRIMLATNGSLPTSRLTILNSGLIGVGTNSPSDLLTLASGNLRVGNGSVSSTLGSDFFAIATSTTDMQGKFYVDSSGNTSASGTLKTFGTVTFGDTVADTLTFNGVLGTINISDNANSTTTISRNSLALGISDSYPGTGVFYVDSSGNINASSTLTVPKIKINGANVSIAELIVRGANTQSGFGTPLQEWRSYDGVNESLLSYIGIEGSFYGNKIYVGDWSTTSSTLQNNLLKIGYTSVNPSGVFNVDSSGNVSASGTLNVAGSSILNGNLILSGHSYPGSDDSYDIGASSTQWRYGNFGKGIVMGDGVTTSSLFVSGGLHSFYLADTVNNGRGKFYVNGYGDVSASGSLKIFGAGIVGDPALYVAGRITNEGNILPATDATYNLGGSGYSWSEIYVDTQIIDSSGALTLVGSPFDLATASAAIINSQNLMTQNGAKLLSIRMLGVEKAYIDKDGAFGVGNGTVTSIFSTTSIISSVQSGFNLGKFNVDSSGNVAASGTLRIFGSASTGGLQISADNTSTTVKSFVSGNGVGAFILDTNSTLAVASSSILLSVRNNGSKVFSIGADGYVAATGTIQANNTSPGPGDFAEFINLASGEAAEPGDVMVVDDQSLNKFRKSGAAYSKAVAGVISDTSAFVIGSAGDSRAALGMTGLVRTKVTAENGSIQVGDYLVTASKPGFAMKYDFSSGKPTGLVGMALEPLLDGEGKIIILINKGVISGNQTDEVGLKSSLGENGQIISSGDLNLNGVNILNVLSIKGKEDKWVINEEGYLVVKVKTKEGDKELYGLQSGQEKELVLSGSDQLENGSKKIVFSPLDQEIIDPDSPIKVTVTLTGEAKGVFVNEKSFQGFTVKELGNGNSNATFDWMAIAKRRPESYQPPVDVFASSTPPTPSAEIYISSPSTEAPVSSTAETILDSSDNATPVLLESNGAANSQPSIVSSSSDESARAETIK